MDAPAGSLSNDSSFYANPATEAFLFSLALFIIVFSLFFAVGTYAVLWKMFNRAGESGWKAIVPVYNVYIMNKIGRGHPSYFWLYLASSFLIFIPIIGALGALIFSILIFVNFLLRYHHSNYALYIILMIFLTPACLLMMKGLSFNARSAPSTPSASPPSPPPAPPQPPIAPAGPQVPLV